MAKDHTVSFKTYLLVLISLLILTVITVGVAQIDFGSLNTFFAMLIATFKAALVLLYFMHLKYDDKIYGIIFGSAVFFVFVLFFFSKLDILTRIAQNSTL